MNDCLFCKIIKGDIPCLKVYEDGDVFAFLDIQPVNVGHTLIVPKAHHENCAETPDETLGALMSAAKRIGAAALKVTGSQGYNVGINCGTAAGQVIMHTHVHVMPRFEGDGLHHWPKKAVTKEEMEKAAAGIAAALTA
ncbi:MAG TPA: HIT family protein [Candidatus Eisenbacteria bacterium]|nr:HIT family protein [Candidatus Eisenbacteria bacterium]